MFGAPEGDGVGFTGVEGDEIDGVDARQGLGGFEDGKGVVGGVDEGDFVL